MENQTHRKSNTGLIIIVGIITILALVLAWAAYNRSGQDLGDQIRKKQQKQ